MLAHEIEAAFDRPALDQMLRDEIPDLMHEPSQLHVDLLSLRWSDVLTTNYDTLLERACRFVVSPRYDIVVNPDDLERSRRPRIIKLHGSFPTDRPFIVTDEDYRRYPLDFAPFVKHGSSDAAREDPVPRWILRRRSKLPAVDRMDPR